MFCRTQFGKCSLRVYQRPRVDFLQVMLGKALPGVMAQPLLTQSTGGREAWLPSCCLLRTVAFNIQISLHVNCSVTKSCPTLTPWSAAQLASLFFTISWNLFKLISTESVILSNHLILCHPLLLPPSIFPSIRVLSNESALCVRWPIYWSFSLSISPSNEYSGLIFFRINWLDLLAAQGTVKSLLQHHSSKALVLQCSLSSQSNSHIHT